MNTFTLNVDYVPPAPPAQYPISKIKRVANGQFWYGDYGFLYKKNVGVGTRKSTKFAAGPPAQCNTYQYLYNKYSPGQGGVGASSVSNRRARNRLATICKPGQECGKFYPQLGLHPTGYHAPISSSYPNITLNQYNKSVEPYKTTFNNVINYNYR